jgi:hypothetical protein
MGDSASNTLLFQDFRRGCPMSGTTKRLDLQFGSFACSVQGFDDPVQPVQQVLQALQNMLEETPEIGSSSIAFDAEAIEQLIGEVARRADLDEDNIEIVPGLIIVQRGAAGEAGLDDGEIEESEAWSRPFVAGAVDAAGPDDLANAGPGEPEPDEAEEDTPIDAAPGYINIFAPGGDAAGAGTETDTDDMPEPGGDEADDDEDPFAARLKRVASEAPDDARDSADADPFAAAEDGVEDFPARDIFAEPGDSTSENIFADPVAANIGAEPVDEDTPVNFFSAADSADESADDPIFEGVFEGSERGEALFGQSDDQPEVEEADEGYTAAGLAQTAGAETVAELMVSAAAWMVLIQGQTTFTRRDVIDIFTTMPGEHSKTLEARIKGFGKAVRNEQLIMVEDGVFGLARTELERFQSLL